MWFPNKTKLDNELFNLLAKMDSVQTRVEAILVDSRVLDSSLGSSLEMEELKSRGSKICSLLIGLRTELKFDRVTVQQVNSRIGKANSMVLQHENLCAAVEQARARATRLVDNHFKV